MGEAVVSLRGVDDSFFFSSRRRHTRLQGDWSSDVCSSDLAEPGVAGGVAAALLGGDRDLADQLGEQRAAPLVGDGFLPLDLLPFAMTSHGSRSEERRVGKECRSRWSPYH